MKANFDESCFERCRERSSLELQILEKEDTLLHQDGIQVFEGEIACEGLCSYVGGEPTCKAQVVQPLALEVPVRVSAS